MHAELLLGPPARQAILSATFFEPTREFHLRELVRLSGLALRSIQVEVDKLHRADLLLERRSGNRRYLRANEQHPLFSPVREIVLRTTGLGDVLRSALGTTGIDLAAVFGSMAAGRSTAASDVDLLVVGTVSLREVVRRLAPAQATLGREVTPVVWSSAEFKRRRTEGDPFLARLKDGALIPLVGKI